MNNLVIKHVIKIQAHFTAAEWQLYDKDPLYAKCVADVLNRELERCVNLGYSKEETSRFVRSMMRCELAAEQGANDSEPHRFLNNVLEQIYG